MNQKALLRRTMREKLREQTTVERTTSSRAIGAHLLSLSRDWHSVIGFLAQPREPDLDGFLRTLLAREVRVAAPHMRAGDEPFYAIAPDWSNIHLNERGWREPQENSECAFEANNFEASAADAIFLPGLAFDLAGNRLGQGGGWYDCVLQNLPPQVLRVGVCFEFQIAQSLPRESHDQMVSIIVTEQRIFYARADRAN